MQDQIQEVKEKTNIVDIIGEYVKLTKAGRHHKGLCPFHSEKSPSFMVSEELQIFKCFGCSEAGDVISFLEKYEGMEFYEALKFLATRVGIELKPLPGFERTDREEILEANSLAAKFYHYILLQHKLGQEGRKYLLETRGLELSTLKSFVLGVAPTSPTALFDFLKKKAISPQLIEKAGLVYKTNRGFMDRFRGRIIFPIHDHRGNVIALAGRILPSQDNKKVGKYINSPETPVYHKSNSLYGLFETKRAIKKAKLALIVEGELDLLSSWQAGIENVVAIKGSALTAGQLTILSRFAERIVLALDSDFAGDNAALKGIFQAHNSGLDVQVVRLGKYKDPDEFARADPGGYRQAVREAVDVWDFIIDLYFTRNNALAGSGKARISKAIIPLLAQIEDTIVQAHYAKKVASRLDVPFDAVAREIAKSKKGEESGGVTEKPIEEEKQRVSQDRRVLLEEQLAALYLQTDPKELIKEEKKQLFTSARIKRIVDELQGYLVSHKVFVARSFYEWLPKELSDGVGSLFLYEGASNDDRNRKEIMNVEHELTLLALKDQLQEVTREISVSEKTENEENLKVVQQKFSNLTKKLTELESS